MRNSMVFYGSFYDVIKKLPHEDGNKLLMAIIEYGLLIKDEIEPLPFAADIAWTNIKPQLDANIRRYENGIKGKEYGCKGGAPKGNNNAKKKTTPNQPLNNPKSTPNINDNVLSNDNILNNISSNEDTIKEKYKKKSKPTLSEEEQTFMDGMAKSYPRIMKMDEPLTYQQYQDVAKVYEREAIIRVLEAMENHKPLLKKNNSAVRTLRNWIKRDLR